MMTRKELEQFLANAYVDFPTEADLARLASNGEISGAVIMALRAARKMIQNAQRFM